MIIDARTVGSMLYGLGEERSALWALLRRTGVLLCDVSDIY